MAKRIKEDLTWVTLKTDNLPDSVKAKHDELRDLFAKVKECKAGLEKVMTEMLTKNGAKLPDEVKVALRLDSKGKQPVGTEYKYAYLRGIAVATATSAKTKTQAGAVSLV